VASSLTEIIPVIVIMVIVIIVLTPTTTLIPISHLPPLLAPYAHPSAAVALTGRLARNAYEIRRGLVNIVTSVVTFIPGMVPVLVLWSLLYAAPSHLGRIMSNYSR
jgi:hypothetical protein